MAAISASKPTSDSQTMAPYPMKRASVSLSSILGVVPDDTSEWKPEMAPQAIVTNRNGNSLPLMIGPPPPTNCVKAGKRMSGCTTKTPTISTAMVPSLT